MNLNEWKARVLTPDFAQKLRPLYGDKAEANAPRYTQLLDLFEKTFPGEDEVTLFSAPGRTEIGGNHTDHEHGRVLAASVDMDMIAAASVTEDHMIRILSEGYVVPVFTTATYFVCGRGVSGIEAVSPEEVYFLWGDIS